MDRRTISFEQAEGAEDLPQQLQLKELSRELRAHIWFVIHGIMTRDIRWQTGSNLQDVAYFPRDLNWGRLLIAKHVFRDHRPIDEYQNNADVQIAAIKKIIWGGNYIDVFGFLQWLLRHESCPPGLGILLDKALENSRSAYRLVDGDTIAPAASEEEKNQFVAALSETNKSGFEGSRAHLRAAAEHLSQGRFADSVRESVSAVESTVKVLSPKEKLSDALAELQKGTHIHASMRSGFEKLYGYASDEKGIRHSLLADGDSKVDEADAVFMLGACASFVTYLIRKGRVSGLLHL